MPDRRADVAVTLDTTSFDRSMRQAAAAIDKAGRFTARPFRVMDDAAHRSLLSGYRAHRVRCPVCNPAGNPPRLGIDGREYHRRQLARRRRRRR